jgi:hypothetical protein
MLEDNLFNENSESKLDLLKNIDLSTKAKESILNKIPSNFCLIFHSCIIINLILIKSYSSLQ